MQALACCMSTSFVVSQVEGWSESLQNSDSRFGICSRTVRSAARHRRVLEDYAAVPAMHDGHMARLFHLPDQGRIRVEPVQILRHALPIQDHHVQIADHRNCRLHLEGRHLEKTCAG